MVDPEPPDPVIWAAAPRHAAARHGPDSSSAPRASPAALICWLGPPSDRAQAPAGGLRGWGPPRQVHKQAQDASTIARDGALKSRGTQRGRPGAHQRPRLELAAPQQPPCLIAAGLAPAGRGAGAVGSGKGKGSSGERAGTGPGCSPQGPGLHVTGFS